MPQNMYKRKKVEGCFSDAPEHGPREVVDAMLLLMAQNIFGKEAAQAVVSLMAQNIFRGQLVQDLRCRSNNPEPRRRRRKSGRISPLERLEIKVRLVSGARTSRRRISSPVKIADIISLVSVVDTRQQERFSFQSIDFLVSRISTINDSLDSLARNDVQQMFTIVHNNERIFQNTVPH